MQKEKNMQKNKFTNTIEASITKLSEMMDTNVIVGKPIILDGEDVIIPISKITSFSLSGGGEYGKTNFFKRNDELPYSLGNGSIVNVKPCGFIIKEKNSCYKYVSAEQSSYEKIFQKFSDVFKEITLE